MDQSYGFSHACIGYRPLCRIHSFLWNMALWYNGFPEHASPNLVLCLTAGYFLFEITWCLYMRTEGLLMVIHHAISITSMLISLWTQHSASEVLLTTWGSELTNPFLQIRWFLRETGNYQTIFGFINDLVFFVLFFILRTVIGTVVAYYLYYATETTLFMKVCGFSFYGLSLVWMIQIFKFGQKKLFNGYKSRIEWSVAILVWWFFFKLLLSF